jgi:hypothetical protein
VLEIGKTGCPDATPLGEHRTVVAMLDKAIGPGLIGYPYFRFL